MRIHDIALIVHCTNNTTVRVMHACGRSGYCFLLHAYTSMHIWNDYANNEYNMRHDHIIYMVPTDQLTDIETDPCPPD